MWLLNTAPGLLTDLYELTMAQAYLEKDINGPAHFEVSVRTLPQNWGFFVMAGLAELESYLKEFHFSDEDIKFLKSTDKFSKDFLEFLKELKPDIKIRSLTEGDIFFPGEPVLEVAGPLIHSQILESYVLNILGFSIVEATLAARLSITAGEVALIDFGLRRTQGPLASIRAARAAKIAGFAATSNLLASKLLDFTAAGTMAHSFIEAYESEEKAFTDFARRYGRDTILLVDTYDSIEGIKKAAATAARLEKEKSIRIKGVRLDSGNLLELAKFARKYFKENDLDFLRIFASGDLDEYKIAALLTAGAPIDGFGIGTNFAVSRSAPAVDIVYKLSQYCDKPAFKKSPDKQTIPGRKTITRIKEKTFKKDIVKPYDSNVSDDLLRSFTAPEDVNTIKQRLSNELACLDDSIKKITDPAVYHVEFKF